jgi:hypothetical protein
LENFYQNVGRQNISWTGKLYQCCHTIGWQKNVGWERPLLTILSVIHKGGGQNHLMTNFTLLKVVFSTNMVVDTSMLWFSVF